MGKKNDSDKPVTAIAKPAATNGDATPAGVAVKKPAKGVQKNAPAKKVVTFSTEDIALRAYFISEHRQRLGIHGDEHTDWINAERQLRAEHRKKAAKKPPGSRKKA